MINHSIQFDALDSALWHLREFWQWTAFDQDPQQWADRYPDLYTWLMSLSSDEIAVYLADSQRLIADLQPYVPEITSLSLLSECVVLPQPQTVLSGSLPRDFDSGIPGRKWQQIQAFYNALTHTQLPWLEWCAGKGHLGRFLSQVTQFPVVSLEWQGELCKAGRQIAKYWQLPITFVEGDAFAEKSRDLIQKEQHAVALHACGDLHVGLLKKGVEVSCRAISISPCCYHLIQTEEYQPLSKRARLSELVLSKRDLKLPLQESVTAGNSVRQQRFTEVPYRLGFDALQKYLLSSSSYLPIPSVPKAELQLGFESFCRWAALQKELVLPADVDFPYWQRFGKERFDWIQRLELLRQAFRRPLELWLILDRVCFLEEHHYHVHFGTFCSKPLTPRNILIQAYLGES